MMTTKPIYQRTLADGRVLEAYVYHYGLVRVHLGFPGPFYDDAW